MKKKWTPSRKNVGQHFFNIHKKLDPPLGYFTLNGNRDTIRIGREIQCVLYAGFFVLCILKNPTHGRHQISQPMWIEAPKFLYLKKKNQSGTTPWF